MECLNIVVLCVSQLKWTVIRHFQSGKYQVLYSGNGKLRRNIVALKLRQKVAQAVHGYNTRSDWISIRLLEKSMNIKIIRVYVPTAEAKVDEIKSFYASI